MIHPYGLVQHTDLGEEIVYDSNVYALANIAKAKLQISGNIVESDLTSGTATVAKTNVKYGSGTVAGLTATVAHGLGTTPKITHATALSTAHIANIQSGGRVWKNQVDATNLLVGTDVSGTNFEWSVLG